MSTKSKLKNWCVKTNVLAVVVVLFFIVSSLPLPDAVGQDMRMVGTTELAMETAELHVENPIHDLLRPSEIKRLNVAGAAAAYGNLKLGELKNAINVRENELIVVNLGGLADKGRPADDGKLANDDGERTKGGTQKVKLASDEVYFAVEAEDGSEEHYIITQLVGARQIKGDPVRHTITWQDVLPYTDIEYRVFKGKLKEYLYLNSPAAAKTIVYKYEIDADSKLELCADGKIKVLSRTDGTGLYEIEAPVAADAEGMPIRYRYEVDESSSILKLVPEDMREFEDAVYPIIVDPTYVVATDCAIYYTMLNSQRKLARKLDGTLCITYHRYLGSCLQIYCAYSTDEGRTWTEEQITSISAAQCWSSIAIDSNDNVHVVWEGQGWSNNTNYYNIQYRKRTSAGWGAQENVTDVGYDQCSPSIAIDSNDNVHVVWYGKGWGNNTDQYNVQYRNRTSSGWQAQESVTDRDNSQWCPSIAIDSNNYVHVVWEGYGWGANSAYTNIQYRRRTWWSWYPQENVTDKNQHQVSPSIAIDDGYEILHVVWHGKGWGVNTSYDNIQYKNQLNLVWGTQESVTDTNNDQFDPSVAIDSNNHVHIVWYGKGWGTNTSSNNIQYRKRVDLSWDAQVGITDKAGDQRHPNLIWAKYPTSGSPNIPKIGYAFVWGDYEYEELKYYASSDLSWSSLDIVEPTAPGDGAELTTDSPMFNWEIPYGYTQTAYKWQAARNSSFSHVVYDSGYVTTSESRHQEPSMSIGTWYWRVLIKTSTNRTTAWTETQSVTIKYTTPTATLTSPNGGEDLIKGEYHAVTWVATGLLSSTAVSLHYSTNNGDSWTLIASGRDNTGHYNWTIPSVETSNALVKVTCTDTYGATVSDVSDRTFTIDPPLVFADESYAGAGTGEQSTQARTPARDAAPFMQLPLVFGVILSILAVFAIGTIGFRRRKRGGKS